MARLFALILFLVAIRSESACFFHFNWANESGLPYSRPIAEAYELWWTYPQGNTEFITRCPDLLSGQSVAGYVVYTGGDGVTFGNVIKVLDKRTGYIVASYAGPLDCNYTNTFYVDGDPACGRINVVGVNSSTNWANWSANIAGNLVSMFTLPPGLSGTFQFDFENAQGLFSVPVYVNGQVLGAASVRPCTSTGSDTLTFTSGGFSPRPEIELSWNSTNNFHTNDFSGGGPTNGPYATEETLRRYAEMVRQQYGVDIERSAVHLNVLREIDENGEALLQVVQRTSDPEIFVTNNISVTVTNFPPTNSFVVSNYFANTFTNFFTNYFSNTFENTFTNCFTNSFSNNVEVVVTNQHTKSNFWDSLLGMLTDVESLATRVESVPDVEVPSYSAPSLPSKDVKLNLWAKYDPSSPLHGTADSDTNLIGALFGPTAFSGFLDFDVWAAIRNATLWIIRIAFALSYLHLLSGFFQAGTFTQKHIPTAEIMGNEIPISPWVIFWISVFLAFWYAVVAGMEAFVGGGTFFGLAFPGIQALLVDVFFPDSGDAGTILAILNTFFPYPEFLTLLAGYFVAWVVCWKLKAIFLIRDKIAMTF